MAELATLADLFEHELRDVYDAEKQILKALPDVIRGASNRDLREALVRHLDETEVQLGRLEEVFASIELKPGGKHCSGMSGILEESDDLLSENGSEAVMDAALVAACQKVEHYEITAYGTLLAWAEMLEYTDAIPLLAANEREEKAADMKLSEIATIAINPAAAEDDEAVEDDEEDGEENDEDEADADEDIAEELEPPSREDMS
jgi:ferritin-like metal-binding protein YciE